MKDSIFEDISQNHTNMVQPFTCHIVDNLKQEYNCPPHWHYYIEIIYVVAGKARIVTGGESYHLLPGDMLLINARQVHSIYSGDDTGVKSIVIKFDPQVLFTASASAFELKYILPFLLSKSKYQKVFTAEDLRDTFIPQLVNEIYDEFTNREYGFELSVRINIGRIFLWIIRKWKQDNVMIKFSSKLIDIDQFQMVFDYVDKNYMHAIDAKTMARICNLSYSYFCRRFKDVTGKTFIEYLNYIRITEAEKLLLSTDMNVTEIASSTGYSDPNYFIRRFKIKNKMSPKQFQKKMLNKNKDP